MAILTVLALETATRAGSVALVRGGALVSGRAGDPAAPHATRLPGDLLSLLADAGLTLRDVDLLAVCLGPGAFTGLRVGIAAIQGLAMATGLPVAGVSSLDAMAAAAVDAGERHVGVWLDATRHEVFAARFEADAASPPGIRGTDAPVSAPPVDVVRAWRANPPDALVGDGVARYAEEAGALGVRVLETPALVAPLVARVALRLAAAGGAGRPHALRPVYVRRPDAELARDARHARTGP
jgi:tRNA threonylcarbamoyladenosine biosynthesis protein TsaB